MKTLDMEIYIYT